MVMKVCSTVAGNLVHYSSRFSLTNINDPEDHSLLRWEMEIQQMVNVVP